MKRRQAVLLGGVLMLAAEAAMAQLAGHYQVQGSNPDGSRYGGRLAVTPRGDAWQFAWQAGGVSSGIAVTSGGMVAVAVGGAECSVVLYRVDSDGSLRGVWVGPAGGDLGRETATPGRDQPAGLSGSYLVDGSNPNGAAYHGAARIVREGEHWRVSWRTGTNFEGYGIERDGYLGVSWGSAECGVVLYRRAANGELDGVWKYYRTGVGHERALRD